MSHQDRQRRVARSRDPDDIVGVLVDQHADLSDLLEQLENSAGDQRRRSFARLDPLLRAHERAEREVVGPALSAAEPPAPQPVGGDRAGLDLLSTMAGLDVDSVAFSDLCEQLVAVVSEHLAAEETVRLPLLDALPEDERRHLGAEVLARTPRDPGATG